jgi:hypothetical protein
MLIPVDTVTKILARIYLPDLPLVRLGAEFQEADFSLAPRSRSCHGMLQGRSKQISAKPA